MKFLQIFRPIIRRKLSNLILNLLMVFSMTSCADSCYKPILAMNKDTITMKIPHTSLIGNQNKIKVFFKIDKTTSKEILEDCKLKVTIISQETFTGLASGTKIIYQDSNKEQKTFTESFEKSLTEFIKIDQSNPDSSMVNFFLHPAEEVIKEELRFELLNTAGKPLDSIHVVWIKSEIVINFLTAFTEKSTNINLKSLKGSINPAKLYLRIQSHKKGVEFQFKKTGKSTALLADLIEDASILPQDQATKFIEIIVDNPTEEESAPFTIILQNSDDIIYDSHNSSNASKRSEFQPGIDQKEEDLKEKREEEQAEEKKLQDLEEVKEIVEEEIKKTGTGVREQEKAIKNETKKLLVEMNEDKREELKGKNPEEKKAIEKKYKNKRQEIIMVATKRAQEVVGSKSQYLMGFFNAIGHNAFFVPLKEAKNYDYFEGIQAGHKISTTIGATETALGPTIVSISIAATIAAGAPSLGTVAAITVPVAAGGVALVAHGLMTNRRAQTNVAKEMPNPFPNRKKQNTEFGKTRKKSEKKKLQESESDTGLHAGMHTHHHVG